MASGSPGAATDGIMDLSRINPPTPSPATGGKDLTMQARCFSENDRDYQTEASDALARYRQNYPDCECRMIYNTSSGLLEVEPHGDRDCPLHWRSSDSISIEATRDPVWTYAEKMRWLRGY